MGNNASSTTVNQNYTSGHHVIKVTPGSPGAKAGLVAFFDYLVEANGVLLDKDSVLIDLLSVSAGKEIKFIVYNSKREEFRECLIQPMDWGEDTKLGISVRFTELKTSLMDYIWHVLEVSPNSPASAAGLVANDDYIIGACKTPFFDSEDFVNYVSRNHFKPIDLHVYNVNTDDVRTVVLTPNPQWGGSGSLGCEMGTGLLHRIPSEENRKQMMGRNPPPVQQLPQQFSQPIPQIPQTPQFSPQVPQFPQIITPPSPSPPPQQGGYPSSPITPHIPILPSTPQPQLLPNVNINTPSVLSTPTVPSTPTPSPITPLPVTPSPLTPLPQSSPFPATPVLNFPIAQFSPQAASSSSSPNNMEYLKQLRERQAQLQEQLRIIQSPGN